MKASDDDNTFCVGVPRRAACETCAGKLRDGHLASRRVMLHQPWPFEPCPHFVDLAPSPVCADTSPAHGAGFPAGCRVAPAGLF